MRQHPRLHRLVGAIAGLALGATLVAPAVAQEIPGVRDRGRGQPGVATATGTDQGTIVYETNGEGTAPPNAAPPPVPPTVPELVPDLSRVPVPPEPDPAPRPAPPASGGAVAAPPPAAAGAPPAAAPVDDSTGVPVDGSAPPAAAAPTSGCAAYPSWYDAQVAFEAGLDPAVAAAMDPDGDAIACEEMMV